MNYTVTACPIEAAMRGALAMTGHHAERAGETALAIDCFDQAAAEAEKPVANASAQSCLRRALALLGESQPTRRFDLLKRLDVIDDLQGNRAAQDTTHLEMAVILARHPRQRAPGAAVVRHGPQGRPPR